MPSHYDNFIRAMKMANQDRHWLRIKRVESDLLGFGVGAGLAKKLIYCYPAGVLERLIKTTRKRQPAEPATYFLNGLKKSRMKHRLERTPTGDEDR